MFKAFIFIFLIWNVLYSQVNYVIPLQKEKSVQIKKAISLYQYLYDLKELNEILKTLFKNSSFKEASTMAEMNIRNNKSFYTIDYLKNFFYVLNGKNDYCNTKGGGYIKSIQDKWSLYGMYLNNYPKDSILTRNFDVIKNNISEALRDLSKNLKQSKNIRPYLKIIFQNLIFALEEIENETKYLNHLKIIKPFTLDEDKKYCMPKNWAQVDNKTTLFDIINFILNGDKKYNIYGIMYYYNKIYNNNTPYIINN